MMENETPKESFLLCTKSGEGRLIGARHADDRMELLLVKSGAVSVRVGTEKISCSAGDILFVPQGMMFSVSAEEGFASVLVLSFAVELLSEEMNRFDSEILYMFDVQAQTRVLLFHPDHPVYATVARAMTDAYEEYAGKDVCYRMAVKSQIFLLMSAVLRFFFGSKNEQDRLIYHNVPRMRPVMEYIGAHYAEKIYVEMLAERIHVSPDYFTKMFRDSIGKTPIDYINALRINRAMEYLADTALPMSEIAEKVGFLSANYLHKIFRQYIDDSPLHFRKAARAGADTADETL